MLITTRVHLFPFRTQKLSSLVPTILGWRRPGKIGRCQHIFEAVSKMLPHFFVVRNAIAFSPAARAFACFTGKFFPRVQREGFCAPYRSRTCRAAKRRSYDTHFFFRAKKETGVPKEKGSGACAPAKKIDIKSNPLRWALI